jgi:phage regulator Rha-like protein
MTDQPSPASKSTSIPGESIEVAKVHTSKVDSRATTEVLVLVPSKGELRIDSRTLAYSLGVKHKTTMNQILKHRERLERRNQVTFKKSVGERKQGGGNAERIALLTEQQACFLLTLSRNTDRVMDLKEKLVQAFFDARRAAEVRQVECLPEYHRCHDAIKVAAAGSPNERFMHINANKAMNRLVGIGPGQRATAGPLTQSLMAVGYAMATKAIREGKDGQTVHQRLKTALEPLAGLLTLGAR